MKKLLLLSSLLSIASLSYSMDNERAKKIAEQNQEMDRMLDEAKAMKAGMEDMSRKLGVPVDQDKQEKKTGGKLAQLNASAQSFADRVRNLNNPNRKVQKEEEKREVLKTLDELKIKRDYSLFVASLDKIRQERKSKKGSNEEFVELEQQIKPTGIYYCFRDMKAIEMIFGARSEKKEAQAKLYAMFSDHLGNRFSHQLNELQESSRNVRRSLQKDPKNETLIKQKELIKNEIKSFSDLRNYDSFYRSSIKGTKFDLFKQSEAATRASRE